jgi:hypothetical protein
MTATEQFVVEKDRLATRRLQCCALNAEVLVEG